jgi:hypothetical protein
MAAFMAANDKFRDREQISGATPGTAFHLR